MNIPKEKLVAFANILDSKGSISIGRDGSKDKDVGYYYEQVRMTGTEEELEELHRYFGGTISSNGPRCGRLWRVTADVARHFMMSVRPFMMVRTEEVDACLLFGKARQEMVALDKEGFQKVAEATRAELNELRELAAGVPVAFPVASPSVGTSAPAPA